MKECVFTLSRAVGPSGMETAATQAARQMLAPLVDETQIDVVGNLIGLRCCGRPNAKRVLLDAHLDEVSMVVTGQKNGFLRFGCLGIDARLLPALTVNVLTDPPMPGVVTCLPPHAVDDADKPFDTDTLYIDCGLTAEQTVPVGTRVVYDTEPMALAGDRVCGKSMDNRACFCVLLRTMELLRDRPLPVDVVVLGSVQEEYAMLGAKTGAFSQMPDYAMVVDVTFGAQPDASGNETFALGGGSAIGVGPMLSRTISDRLRALRPKAAVEILEGSTGTNAMAVQIAREGIPTGMVSLPLRYMHTPGEVVSLGDIEESARLIADWVLSLEGEVSA